LPSSLSFAIRLNPDRHNSSESSTRVCLYRHLKCHVRLNITPRRDAALFAPKNDNLRALTAKTVNRFRLYGVSYDILSVALDFIIYTRGGLNVPSDKHSRCVSRSSRSTSRPRSRFNILRVITFCARGGLNLPQKRNILIHTNAPRCGGFTVRSR
jgi:hypothetical protein